MMDIDGCHSKCSQAWLAIYDARRMSCDSGFVGIGYTIPQFCPVAHVTVITINVNFKKQNTALVLPLAFRKL